jgi:lipopolysaccharide biosynthesis regulator YciM
MNFGEHTLLVVLVAFAAGIALGRFWPGGKTLRRSRPQQEPTSIHYILGIDLLAAGEIDRAISELTLAAREDTDAIEIYLILGNLLRDKGQIERAIQIHQSVLHRPRLSNNERAHGLLCLGVDFKRAGFRQRAIETFREVIDLEPANAYAISNLIRIYESEQDWEKALATQDELFQMTGELDGTLRAFLHSQIGRAAFEADDPARARRAFDEAGRAAPHVAAPYLYYGDLLESEGEAEAAEAKWLELVTGHPRLAHLAFSRLNQLNKSRDARGASATMAAIYETVIANDERDWRARIALARLRADQGNPDQAFDLLMAAVRSNPYALTVHLEVWRSLVADNKREERTQTYLDEVDRSVSLLDPYICIKCNYRANGILWRCPHCQEWNTFIEERVDTVDRSASRAR